MKNNNTIFGILGAGGQARETASYAPVEPMFYAVQADFLTEGLVDINNVTQDQAASHVVAAVGSPSLRVELVTMWPGNEYTTIIAPEAYIGVDVEIGEGTVIAPGSVITTRVSLGRHTIVNIGATISHDVSVGEFVTIGPGVNIGGNAIIGNGVFIGIGAKILNGISIADGVVIGAGAVVLRDINEVNSVYVGVPAKMIKINEGWLREV
jgi:sugar O-acyltransferase (sialic acid O-acetyltransferase NeuD family)